MKSETISRYNNKYLWRLLVLAFMGWSLVSCVSQREVEYIQKKDDTRKISSFNEHVVPEYKLKPSDELFIQINSLDDASINMFTGTGNIQQMMNTSSMQPYSASLVSYTISKEGYLLLPVLGSIYVKDHTVSQVSSIIKDSLSNILSQPNVTVKLVNRYVSVLGEVRNPGHFPYAQERLTIFDALGLAGDITEYGNRNEIILTRNEDGVNLRINLDLTKSEILASEYYIIKPNDIVYVKPLHKKFWGMREFPFSIILSTLSTALLFYSVLSK